MRILIFCFAVLMLTQCKSGNNEMKSGEEASPMMEDNGQWLRVKGDEDGKEIVLISGDEEYRSEEALPQMAQILSTHHGFNCTVLFAQDPEKPGVVDGNYTGNIPGLEALEKADLMIIFTRFRNLPDEQIQHIDSYLKAGKPVVGIRTATHAFKFDEEDESTFKHYGNYYEGEMEEWKDGFGRVVLGEKWVNHHGHHKHQSTRGIVSEDAKSMEISNGLEDGKIWGSTDVYGVRLPLPGDSQPIVLGQVINRAGEYDENDIFYGMKPTDDGMAKENDKGEEVNKVLMPIAWTKTYQLPGGKRGRAFASTIGSSSDMLDEGVRRLLVNGVFWALDQKIPDKANVNLVGNYTPSAYGFKSDEYWDELNYVIADYKM